MDAIELVKDLSIVAVAGSVATKVMEAADAALYKYESEEDRKREDRVRPGPPHDVAAKKMSRAFGVDLEGDALAHLGMALHYGLPSSCVPVYFLLRRRARMNWIASGLVVGAVMSLLVDETLTPLMGIAAPNRQYPLSTHVRGFLSHLASALTIAAVTEIAWTTLRRKPH
jgi:hypothetical protein